MHRPRLILGNAWRRDGIVSGNGYRKALAPFQNGWWRRLIHARGKTILEIACGAGDTCFAAAARIGPTGKLISTDFAPNMVDAAQRQSQRLGLTNVEHRVIDAHNMDLADSCVDGVLCRWGF